MSDRLALALRDSRGRIVQTPIELRLWGKIAGNAMGRDVIGAHVAAYILTYGRVPEGREVCHSCHHKCCCNPHHLFAGTHSENIKQTWRGGGLRRSHAA